MATIEDFILRFKTQGLSAVNAAKTQVSELRSDIENFANVGGAFSNTLGGIIGKLGPLGLAASATGVAIGGLALKAINLADQLQDVSAVTGISASKLLSLRSSILDAGGDIDTFQKVTSRLTQTIGDAANGSVNAGKLFEQLGVYVLDSNGNLRDSNDILDDTLKSLADIEDPVKRLSLATQVLGKEAAKVDWSQVKAGRDAVTDEQIKLMADYRGEIDKLVISLEENLVKAVGSVIKAFNDKGLATALANFVEQIGSAIGAIDPTNLLFKDRQGVFRSAVSEARNARLAAEVGGGRGLAAGPTAADFARQRGSASTPAGRFRGTSEEDLRNIADSERRIRDSLVSSNLNRSLQEQNRLTSIALIGASQRESIDIKANDKVIQASLKARADAAKAIDQINSNEKLTAEQRTKERAAKESEIYTRLSADIAQIRSDQEADLTRFRIDQERIVFNQKKTYSDQISQLLGNEKTEVQKITDLISEQPDKYKEIGDELIKNAQIQDRNLIIVKEITRQQELQKRQYAESTAQAVDFVSRIQDSGREVRKVIELQKAQNRDQVDAVNERFALEQRMLEFTKQRATPELISAQQADELGVASPQQMQMLRDYQAALESQQIQEMLIMTTRLEHARQIREIQESFSSGWKDAFDSYANEAKNAANQARTIFDTFARGFEDAIVKAVQTGKLSFKDLANSIIADIVRIQAQKMFMSLFGPAGFLGSLFFGKANGGPTEAMKPIIVGERGPELFIPRMAGNVISNQNLTKPSSQTMPNITNVTYNINAVDAPSFRALVARDPQFIYNVSEVGRRGQPTRRLA